MDTTPVVVTTVVAATTAEVWKALTDPDSMKHWYFPLKEFRPERGFSFSFSGGPSEARQYMHQCVVTEAVPEQKLCYSWRYEGYDGNSLVCFTMEPVESGTRVTVHHSGLETLEAQHPDFARSNFMQGWNEILNRSLVHYLSPEQ